MSDKPKEHRFVVIRYSGDVVSMKHSAGGWMDFWEVLSAVRTEVQSAGSTADLPKALMMDGQIVVDGGLHSIAYNYGEALWKAQVAARERIMDQFRPEWLPA